MARHYVLGSWANADEFDYSGEQLMGHRQGKSVCMDHMLPSGMANLKRYGDPVEQKPKAPTKPKPTAFEKVCTLDKTYERLCNLSEELDQQLDNGELSFSDWSYARKQLDKKLQKSWSNICNLRGWNNEGKEELEDYSNSLTFDCEDWHVDKQERKQVDFSVIPKSSVFSELSDQNVFKQMYAHLLTAKRAWDRLIAAGKDIIQEGLI